MQQSQYPYSSRQRESGKDRLEDFDAFRDAYQRQYRPRRKGRRVDSQLSRLERFLVHWGTLPPSHDVLRYDELVDTLRHPIVREAIGLYLYWCEAKYQRPTINGARAAAVAFFLWFHEHSPASPRLHDFPPPVS